MITKTGIELTDEQMTAVDFLIHSPKQVRIMGGIGGTGKSTLVQTLMEELDQWHACSYTGKAAQVLRSKGVTGASTIHSLIYYYDKELDEFLLKPYLDCDGIIIDEGSMVPKPLWDDLTGFGLPIIVIGDHGQLEPIGDGSFNLMLQPDITLETIHRNAGEIARFADHLRKGNDARTWKSKEGKVRIIRTHQMDSVDWPHVDQVLCAYNATRVNINKSYREELGYGPDPEVGDRIMCLQNDKDAKVFNGMQGVLARLDTPFLTMESDGIKYTCRYNPDAFGSQNKPQYDRNRIPFDYAYCCTTHKFQGSEADHVCVIEQKCSKWSHARWAYTSASRAKNQLTWVLAN